MDSSVHIPTIPVSAISAIGKLIRRTKDRVKVDLKIGFESYYKTLERRHSVYRTVLTLDKDLDLLATYHDLRYKRGEKEIQGRSIWANINAGDRILIRGSGGSGKSLYTKIITLWTIKSESDRFAIHIDLKLFNEGQPIKLKEVLYKELAPIISKIDHEGLEYLLANMPILIVFDGFDEIEDARRLSALKQIQLFGDAHSNAAIIVTSRPHEAEAAWAGFEIYDVQSMNTEEAKSLISKFPYDKKVKQRFLDDLETEIWPRHKSFVENPLLCTLVVVAYARDGFLFDKLSEFYQQAFDAVLFRHDKSKEFYVRKFVSGISITKCEDVFSAFCFKSYLASDKRFSREKIIEYIKDALEMESQPFDPSEVLRDFVECVCLIVKEGTDYKFSHRSFQEYFAAKFAKSSSFDVSRVCDRFAMYTQDTTLLLYYQLNTDAVIRDWVASRYEILINANIESEFDELFFGWIFSGGATAEVKETPFVRALNSLLQISCDPKNSFVKSIGIFLPLLDSVPMARLNDLRNMLRDNKSSISSGDEYCELPDFHFVGSDNFEIIVPRHACQEYFGDEVLNLKKKLREMVGEVVQFFSDDYARAKRRLILDGLI